MLSAYNMYSHDSNVFHTKEKQIIENNKYEKYRWR